MYVSSLSLLMTKRINSEHRGYISSCSCSYKKSDNRHRFECRLNGTKSTKKGAAEQITVDCEVELLTKEEAEQLKNSLLSGMQSIVKNFRFPEDFKHITQIRRLQNESNANLQAVSGE